MILSSFASFSQKVVTKNGKVIFEASVPAFEEIKAKSESTSCVLITSSGEIAALALVKGFHFKVPLMEEHFNENYIESDKYPKATFKGKIENFEVTNLTESAKSYTIKGKLELHGKSKEISIIAKIKKTDAGIQIVSNFSINADDFAIDIPKVVSKKVSKKVSVDIDFLLK